jgi:hypothetical protein
MHQPHVLRPGRFKVEISPWEFYLSRQRVLCELSASTRNSFKVVCGLSKISMVDRRYRVACLVYYLNLLINRWNIITVGIQTADTTLHSIPVFFSMCCTIKHNSIHSLIHKSGASISFAATATTTRSSVTRSWCSTSFRLIFVVILYPLLLFLQSDFERLMSSK